MARRTNRFGSLSLSFVIASLSARGLTLRAAIDSSRVITGLELVPGDPTWSGPRSTRLSDSTKHCTLLNVDCRARCGTVSFSEFKRMLTNSPKPGSCKHAGIANSSSVSPESVRAKPASDPSLSSDIDWRETDMAPWSGRSTSLISSVTGGGDVLPTKCVIDEQTVVYEKTGSYMSRGRKE